MQVGVEVVLLTELVGDGDAGEELAPVALDGVDIEEDGEGGEQAHEDQQEGADLHPLAVGVRPAEAERGTEEKDRDETPQYGTPTRWARQTHSTRCIAIGEGPRMN